MPEDDKDKIDFAIRTIREAEKNLNLQDKNHFEVSYPAMHPPPSSPDIRATFAGIPSAEKPTTKQLRQRISDTLSLWQQSPENDAPAGTDVPTDRKPKRSAAQVAKDSSKMPDTVSAPLTVAILTIIGPELQAMKKALGIREKDRITGEGSLYYEKLITNRHSGELRVPGTRARKSRQPRFRSQCTEYYQWRRTVYGALWNCSGYEGTSKNWGCHRPRHYCGYNE